MLSLLQLIQVTVMRQGAVVFFSVSFLLDFHGSKFILDVSWVPIIEPSSTGRATVDA